MNEIILNEINLSSNYFLVFIFKKRHICLNSLFGLELCTLKGMSWYRNKCKKILMLKTLITHFFLIIYKAIKVTVVNQTWHFIYGGILEITFTVPLKSQMVQVVPRFLQRISSSAWHVLITVGFVLYLRLIGGEIVQSLPWNFNRISI